MQPEAAIKTELDAESPESSINVSSNKEFATGRPPSSGKGSVAQNGSANGQFPPPKTDKPRPHVCGTCGRSFARLEHLKRHERSHTKEKPFECPECTRCFARRDLLLRHQQKLHMTNTTSSRPRSGRRESVSSTSVSGGRVRKNSMATGSVAGTSNIGGTTHRPRANTLGHIDLSGLSFLDVNPNFGRMNALGLSGHSMGMGGLPGPMNYEYRGMSNSLANHGLPKLDTHAINSFDITNSLRTAPPYAFGGLDIDQLFSPGTTINPAQLHFSGSLSSTQPSFSSLEPFTVHSAIETQAQAEDFGWMRSWNMQLAQDNNEQAIEESSPSRMSSGDSPPEDYNESMNNSTVGLSLPNNYQWNRQDRQARQSMSGPAFQLGALSSGLPNLEPPQETVSQDTLTNPTPTNEGYLQQMMLLQQQQQHQHHQNLQQQPHHQQQQSQPQQQQQQQQQSSPNMAQGQSQNHFAPSLSTFSDSPSISSSSMNGSARHSSVTSMSTESITDATRQALLVSLSQPSTFGHNHRKYSQPTISSPLSPGRTSHQAPSLPATDDIRRYVNAFIQYAHPHLPFMHISTLSFDLGDYSNGMGASSPPLGLNQNGTNGINGGVGCLILGMAAIGALYEYDHPASKELFEAGKKMLTLYLEERRKADMSAAVNHMNSPGDGPNHTPLWLVQATLLSVVYGHQCGDKTAADIASNQFAALISLARAAELAQPPMDSSPGMGSGRDEHGDSNDVDMRESSITPGDSISRHQSAETDLQSQWLTWKVAEERKRTLFAIFILSSLLTTAYNHTPTIMNSEILLDLPCEEELWSAESAQEWQNRGGLAAAEQNAVSFAGALSSLLTANQRQGQLYSSTAYNNSNPLGALQAGEAFADNELRPSTFGCLVLINALHNYIWETRSRHHGSQWTPQETQSMFSHIEPALNAWQAAWRANDHHKLERPNPFLGTGPLSADCVPLLDLAFVRLFVNLGQSKEAFWHRDFDAMADELARGSEIVQHADVVPANMSTEADGQPNYTDGHAIGANRHHPSRASSTEQSLSRRERHLRKAAFYAADSLTIACNWNLTYADISAHELPVQSAMCFFDCSQVLAEWACTVQERVGSYLGVLGRDAVDYAQVPAIMMLETEDAELLRKIEQICESLEAKRLQQENLLGMDLLDPSTAVNSMHSSVNLSACGYGSKILRVTAMMLEKAVVWPVTHVMAKALETQACHMDQRAESSIVQ